MLVFLALVLSLLLALAPPSSAARTNQPPVAAITVVPSRPVEGQRVDFISTSNDPDGAIVSYQWDFNGDGVFDDASGYVAVRTFPPGTYTVRLQVTDNEGAAAIADVTVQVAARTGQLLNPFPVVRLSGKTTRTGFRIRRLSVHAPSGSRIEVRCRGRGCPQHRRQVRTADLLRFRRFERNLRAGAVLQVYVTNPSAIGKYTRFRVRGGKPPKRSDLCIPPGGGSPERCPSR